MNNDKAAVFLFYWRVANPNGAHETPVAEYPFSKSIGRKHKFDWAFVAAKLAVEVDGGTHAPHGGRHGSDRDREKMNLAVELGWRVLRYSPDMLTNDPAACIEQVMRCLTR